MRHQLSEADDGTVVPAETGDEVEICLHEMPSGGYRWLLGDTPADVLEQLEQRFDFDEGTVGGRNEAHFLFRVKTAGRAILRLRYDRPWAKGEPPLKSYSVTVDISERTP